MRGRIIGALGGWAAEELVFGDVSTGAESDLEQATAIARQMVGRWGMSEAIGPVTVLPRPDQEQFPGLDGNSPAPDTRSLVDREVRLDECDERARNTLRDHRTNLDRLAQALLDKETLDAEEAYAAAGIAPASSPQDEDLRDRSEPRV
nr:hypothetical protein [Kribbella pittospori]